MLICIIGTHWNTTGRPPEDHWKHTGNALTTNNSFFSGIPVYTGSQFQAHWIATGLPLAQGKGYHIHIHKFCHSKDTVFLKTYAQNFVMLCRVVIISSFLEYVHALSTHVHQGRFIDSGGNCMITSQIAKFMWPTWVPHGSCRPQLGPILAPWTLLSGLVPVKQSWRIWAKSTNNTPKRDITKKEQWAYFSGCAH